MAFRPTEFTVRDLLFEELKKRHVRTANELSFTLPEGRKPPDGILENGSTYVLETKLGGQADYFEDIKRLTEWIKLRHAPIRGAFAVLFPAKLRQVPLDSLSDVAHSPKAIYEVAALFRDERPGDRKTGSLSEVVDWIAEQVLRPPIEVEPDTHFVVRVLSGAVGKLSAQMRDLDFKQFEDIFGGQPVFDNILEVKPDRLPLESLRKAAAYLLINQLIFYDVLARAEPDKYPRVDADALRSPSDLTGYFRRVLEVDYAPTFGFDVASRLPAQAGDTVRSVLEIVQLMGLARLRQDVLGKIFHNLIPLSIRKPVAAFYTNKQAADLLAELVIRSPGDTVLDPAVGSGTLLVACYQRKRKLSEGGHQPFTEEDHVRFLGQEITGIDIMPFAAHLAVVHLSLQAPRFTTQKVRIAVWDSSELKPGDSIPSITRELSRAFQRPTLDMFESGHPLERAEYVTKGTFALGGIGGDEIHLDPVDVVIANPPFTSSDRLGADYKARLKDRLGPEYQPYLQGKISFQGHFLLIADRFLKPGGRLAMVLPLTTLTAKAFGPLVGMLTKRYTLEAVVVGLGRSAFSENTSLSEVLLVASKKPPALGHRFALLGTKKSPVGWTAGDVISLARRLERTRAGEDDLAVLRWIPQRELAVDKGGLTSLLPQLTSGYAELSKVLKPILSSKLMVPYSEWEKKAGVTALYTPLGNKEAPGPEGRGGVFFGSSALNVCRSEARALKKVDRLIRTAETDDYINAKDTVTESLFKIPRDVLSPAVRRISYYPRLDVSSETDFVVNKYYPGLPEIMRAIYGEDRAEQFVARVRDRWAERIQEGMSHVTFARRIQMAAPGTCHLAVFTREQSFTGASAWCFRGISEENAKLLCLWLNSSLFMFQVFERRAQTEGTWWYLNKHGFGRTRMPDLSSLSAPERQQLLRVFDSIRGVEFPSILDQLRTSFEGRVTLDRAWLSILGVPGGEQESLLKSLHGYLHETLRALRATMAKD